MSTATARTSKAGRRPAACPRLNKTLCRLFLRYLRGYFPKHFHALRIQYENREAIPTSGPVVCFINHAGWWDPLTAFQYNRFLFPQRFAFAPIDATALERYPFLGKIGLFGIDAHSPRGAVQLLKTAGAIFERPDASLWITPQGRFCDPRERPIRFERGLGHLAKGTRGLTLIPVAIEYCHWNERLPELLVRVGDPVKSPTSDDGTTDLPLDTDAWTAELEHRLEATMDRLAVDAIARDKSRFEVVQAGRSGVSSLYDPVRRAIAWMKGKRYAAEHDVVLEGKT
ncbi:lysophospholipid acyltransferase family protein [Stratiformator vulcanicus]|uniref:Phospholipid/glycerol acyltransferase domain-containing protein n=1 Tax=Stratiformator vulcanicus TaxID=2527980 RepID=A0A517R627_9PLAN|nr:lysophospholipid acyltransferase family protein [Stratiformator vulcanicus]QDT39295.1 hypothetical protein Pan189_37010 [Stratiformator vulcanicus]